MPEAQSRVKVPVRLTREGKTHTGIITFQPLTCKKLSEAPGKGVEHPCGRAGRRRGALLASDWGCWRGAGQGSGRSYLGAQVDFEALLTHGLLAAGQGLDRLVFQAHPAHQHHEGRIGIPDPTQAGVGWSSQQAGRGERFGRQVELQLDAAAIGGQAVRGEGQPGAREGGGGAGSVHHRRGPRRRGGRRERLGRGVRGQDVLHAEHGAEDLPPGGRRAPLAQHVQDQGVRSPDADPGLRLLTGGRLRRLTPSLLSVPSFLLLLFQLLWQSLGIEGPGERQSCGRPGGAALRPARGPPAPRGLRGARVRAARVASAAAAARIRRGGARPGRPAAVPPRPRGLGGARGAASGVARLRGPAAAHRALLLAHRRPRPAPPLPIQPPGPPPGAGGQQGQRRGSTRGSASASGSLLRAGDASSSLRGARAPGPRRAGARARAAPPPRPPARPGTASGAPRAALSRRERPPHMQGWEAPGPPRTPGGAEGSGGGGVSPAPSPVPAAGHAGRAAGGRGPGPGGLRHRGARGEVQPERGRAAGVLGTEAERTTSPAPESPSALLAAPDPTPWRTPPHTYTRRHTRAPSGCDLSRDALRRPEFTLGSSQTLPSRQLPLGRRTE